MLTSTGDALVQTKNGGVNIVKSLKKGIESMKKLTGKDSQLNLLQKGIEAIKLLSYLNAIRNNFKTVKVGLSQTKAGLYSFTTDFDAMAVEVANQVTKLHHAGVNQVIIPTLPSLTVTPDFQTILKGLPEILQPLARQLGEKLTEKMNNKITNALGQASNNIVRIDTTSLFNDVIANMNDYGFSHSGQVCVGTAYTACTPSKLDKPIMNPDEYVWGDGFHPGPEGHRILANYIQNVIDAPKSFALPPEMILRQTSQANEHLRQFTWQTLPEGMFSLISYEYAKNNSLNHLIFGSKLSPHWQITGQISRGELKHNDNQTNLQNKGTLIDLALNYYQDNWLLGTTIGKSFNKFKTERYNLDGIVTHLQNAKFDASNLHIGVFAGLNYPIYSANLFLGTDVTYHRISVDKINTVGKLYEMAINKQKHNYIETGMNIKLNANIEQWTPYIGSRFAQLWHNKSENIITVYNNLPFITEVEKHKSYNWRVETGLNYESRSLPLTVGIALSRDLKMSILRKNTRISGELMYRF